MRVIVVDDEPLACKGLCHLLRKQIDIDVVAECNSADTALRAIEELRPDAVFLDIEMPGKSGLSIPDLCTRKPAPFFVFVTAHSQHAVTAFDFRAVDYVLKPVETSRLLRACDRLREAISRRDVESDESDGQPGALPPSAVTSPIKGRLVVHCEDRAYILRPSEIDWIEAAGNYVKIHTGNAMFVVRGTLNSLEVSLQEEPFARIHRSTLVNLDSVKELQQWFSGEIVVVMKDNTKLKLSRTYRRVFETRLRVLA
jgi:two-component system LytT family response regulator